jgi:hypothetical protein
MSVIPDNTVWSSSRSKAASLIEALLTEADQPGDAPDANAERV